MRTVLGAAAAVLLVAPAAQDTDPIVTAASAYVAQYQEQLTSVVAKETYTQHVRVQIPRDKGMLPTRTTTSEIFFLYVPGHDWMAMRDVELLNGRPVGHRPDLMQALRTLPAPQVARKFKAYNSRFNLGYIVRTFNEPTLSLLVLDPKHRHRFRFEVRRRESVPGETLTVVAFREVAEPTLVRNLDGGPAYSTGEFAIEPSTGRVHRAVMALTIGSVQMTLSTLYAPDARLGMLVPVRSSETYQDFVSETDREEIVCEATYTNFRRFEVKAVIR